MGAILAGSAITRGMEKRQRIQSFGGMGGYGIGGGGMMEDRTRTFGAYPVDQRQQAPTVAPSDARREKAKARLARMRRRKGMNPDG